MGRWPLRLGGFDDRAQQLVAWLVDCIEGSWREGATSRWVAGVGGFDDRAQQLVAWLVECVEANWRKGGTLRVLGGWWSMDHPPPLAPPMLSHDRIYWTKTEFRLGLTMASFG